MADVDLSDLCDRIRPQADMAPESTITQFLVDIMRDFCNVTRCYVYEADPDTIIASISDYDIDMPNSHVVPITIESMSVDDAPCEPRKVEWFVRSLGANWRTRDADDFRYFTQLSPLQYTFPCVPTKNGTTGGVRYFVSLKPKLDATVIEEEQSNEWLEAWTCGVLWKLKGMSNKPWSDRQGASDKFKEYHAMRGAARIRCNRDYGNVVDRLSNPRGFA